MNDWNACREALTVRLREFSKLAPDTMKGIVSLGQAGTKTNHLDAKTRELISLAVAVTTRCDGCIAVHVAEAKRAGATVEELSETLGVAINLNAGAALVYSARALDAFDKV
ncbi:carboxymuconolactone decarboxylase family protein [Burkholderia sp. JKS000303]|uniref:carboxymuconolactone decarboxylase family protein n=1 Tax=Burkholderia sp. JKS000303 TaxID=1938747 RepID=UPI000BF9B171|nr:carboxymuconolactone decarboxylase family protein [Burkholderia sp. JKS000303]PFH19684.1 AhpD family alkylhydroperoxidase [Burkholderia sp. JKS000303]